MTLNLTDMFQSVKNEIANLVRYTRAIEAELAARNEAKACS